MYLTLFKYSKRNAPSLIALTLLLMPVCAAAQVIRAGAKSETQAPVTPPESPAGRRLAAWLEAFNSGRRENLRRFVAANFAQPPNGALPVDRIADRHYGLYSNTGGLDLRKIEAASPDGVTAAVRARHTGYWMKVRVNIAPQPPHSIMGFGFRNTEAPADLLPNEKLTEKEVRDRLDGLVAKLVAADAFSGTVLVAKNGRPFYERACGMANRTWKAPNRTDTKFNLASLGKMFTAVAVVQLAEQGKLSYEDTVGKILPDYPNKDVAEKVTVHQLLTHTSGIPAGSFAKALAALRQGHRKVGDYLPSFANDPLAFEPGTKFEYTNNGYVVLGAIIEKASGRDYYDYIRQYVYGPAGMSDSDSYELDTDPPNLATGYMDGPGGSPRRSNTFFLPVKGVPSGLGYSTARDLLKFTNALRNHTLLGARSLDLIWAGKVEYATAPGSQYAYGFAVKRYNGARIVGHSGGWFGMNTQVDVYPDLGYTVVILSNYDADTNSLANKLREWLTQGHS
jgi:CubicO group peptidase (beta-lactamase class C family)